MSYNDSYGRDDRRDDYGGGGRGGGYGEERRHERRDDYEDGGRRQERRDEYEGGGGGYGGRQERRDDYDSGNRRDDNYGGGRQERRDDYGGSSGGGYGRDDDRQGGGGGGGYDRPGPGRAQNDELYGGGGSQGGNYYDKSQRYDDEPLRPSGGRQHGGNSSGTPYASGGSGDFDSNAAVSAAQEHAGGAIKREDNIFASVFDNLMGKQSQLQNEGVDEDEAVNAHQKMYGGGGGEANEKTMGAAAAMQALKMFNGGGSQGNQGGQSQFIGIAMAQAAKLFDQQSANGNTTSGASKEGAIQQAGEMALKFYLKSQFGGGGGAASGGSSGIGGLLNMASKFMK